MNQILWLDLFSKETKLSPHRSMSTYGSGAHNISCTTGWQCIRMLNLIKYPSVYSKLSAVEIRYGLKF